MTLPTATNPTNLSQELSQGITLVLAPHMDDAVLGCGGTLAKLTNTTNVHVVYATDGARSPVPDSLRPAKPSPELCAIRTQEAKAALQVLGIPKQNIHFLSFPDGALDQHHRQFTQAIFQCLQQINPDYVLMPFRHDCHPDHIAVNHIATNVIRLHQKDTKIFEYFIYYRLQLLPKKDIRTYIHSKYLITSDICAQAAQKRTALNAFKTQITQFYSWQPRPLLSATLIKEVCTTPEIFLQANATAAQHSPFSKGRQIIPFITKLEPALKGIKTRGALFLKTLKNLSNNLLVNNRS